MAAFVPVTMTPWVQRAPVDLYAQRVHAVGMKQSLGTRMEVLWCPCGRGTARAESYPQLCLGSGGGSGVGNIHGGDHAGADGMRSGGNGNAGNGDVDEHAKRLRRIHEALRQHGLHLDDVPADMLERATPEQIETLLEFLKVPVLGRILAIPYLRDRLLANPKFLVILLCELALGVAGRLQAEIQGRKENFWKEFDLVLCNLMFEIFGDFLLVSLLSPAVSFAPHTTPSAMQQFFSSLPQNVFQPGAFSVGQRLSTFVVKGVQFFCVGVCAQTIGHVTTKGLLLVKSSLNPDQESKPLPPLSTTAVMAGGFLATSSNLRYNLVNGIETWVLSPIQNNLILVPLVVAVRYGNIVWGGMQWIQFSRFMGL